MKDVLVTVWLTAVSSVPVLQHTNGHKVKEKTVAKVKDSVTHSFLKSNNQASI